jgi:hypothetical protein
VAGKLVSGYLGGIYLLDGGRVVHIHIVRQLLDGKTTVLGLQPPHTVVKTTAYPAHRSRGCAQLKQVAKLFDMNGAIR